MIIFVLCTIGSSRDVSKAIKIPRTAAGYCVTDGNIAAIDFGTTSVSLAYATKGDREISTLTLDTEINSTRVLNVILIKKQEGGDVSIIAFGRNARERFIQLRTSALKDYIYFERIKMLMKREEVQIYMHVYQLIIDSLYIYIVSHTHT